MDQVLHAIKSLISISAFLPLQTSLKFLKLVLSEFFLGYSPLKLLHLYGFADMKLKIKKPKNMWYGILRFTYVSISNNWIVLVEVIFDKLVHSPITSDVEIWLNPIHKNTADSKWTRSLGSQMDVI